MSDRAYTVSEIYRMRDLVRDLLDPPCLLVDGKRYRIRGTEPEASRRDQAIERRVEDQLRTYLVSAADPDELQDKLNELLTEQDRLREAAAAKFSSDTRGLP